MTDKEILDKAIEKAVQNNYIGFNVKSIKETFTENKWDFEDDKYPWYYGIIFSPEFGKAFFGSYKIDLSHTCEIEIWKYHQQLMILEDNRLHYLEKFL